MKVFQTADDFRLGAVSLRVRDLGRMVDFYSNFLGLAKLREQGDQVQLGFELEQPLVILNERAQASQRPEHAAGLYHFALLVPDRERLAQALQRFLRSGTPLQGVADHFVSEAIYLGDPEGNGIEIYADRPRSSWEWKDGQLQMGTAALDIEDLLALVRDEQEDPAVLSAGTVMGHLHLQVSDLQQAMHFYERILGLDPMGSYGTSAAFYSAGGYHHHIGMNTWASANGPRARPDMLGLDTFEMIFRDPGQITTLIESFALNNTAYIQEDDGVAFEDPSGNRIKVKAERENLLPS